MVFSTGSLNQLPAAFEALFADERIALVGVNVNGDGARLARDFKCTVNGLLNVALRKVKTSMEDLAAAVERADEASRMGAVDYAERVEWRLTEADESRMTIVLTDTNIELIHDTGDLDTNVSISGTGAGSHEGTLTLAGIDSIWVVHYQGVTSIEYDRPQHQQ